LKKNWFLKDKLVGLKLNQADGSVDGLAGEASRKNNEAIWLLGLSFLLLD